MPAVRPLPSPKPCLFPISYVLLPPKTQLVKELLTPSARKRRNGVTTSFLKTGQPTCPLLRCVVAGEVAGARGNCGGFGASLANLAHLLELAAIREIETASRFGRAQSPAPSRPARGRGSLRLAKDELFKINRNRFRQRVGDQMAEFNDREKAHEGRGGRYASGNCRRARRSPGCERQDSPNRAPGRGR